MKNHRRSRGTGSLFLRNGSYVFQWSGIDGKLKTQTMKDESGKPVTSKTEARKIAEKILQEQGSVRIEAESLNNRIEAVQKIAGLKGLLHRCKDLIPDMLIAWQSSPHYSKSNEAAKISAIRHFQDWLQNNHPAMQLIADITPDIAQRYMLDYWQTGISARAYNVRRIVLAIVFRAFFDSGNPFEAIQKKTESSECKQPFTMSQLAAIWKKLEDADYYMLNKDEMKDLYVLALHTGLRCIDCCLLLWSSVDLVKNIITVTPKKTRHSSRKTVTIPIAAPLLAVLQKRVVSRTSDYVFPQVAERYRQNRFGISSDTQRLLEASGIATQAESDTQRKRPITLYGFHSFRHTTATMLANSGISPLVIKDILGHTTIGMTSHYSHISLDSKREAILSLTISDSSSQSQHLLSGLAVSRLPALSEFLQSILSDHQQRAIRAFLA